MKHFMTRTIILILLAFVGSNMYAYDFQVNGIYYNILSPQDLTVEVTYESYDFNSYSGIVNIPETVEYKNKTFTITSIGEKAFFYCNNLKEVTISNQINKIGESAFYHCSQLSKIVIPNSVVEIGAGTFGECSSLTQISLPSDLKEISNGLFIECTNLKEIIISTNVKTIGLSAFKGCASIETIIIPGSVEEIRNDAFSGCSSLKKVIFEEGENSIGLGKLTKVNHEDYLTILYNGFFHDCPIEEVILNKNMGFDLGGSVYGNKLTSCYSPFSGIDTFTKLTIGKQVTAISYHLFASCNSLTNIELGDNVTAIYESAFGGCSNVKKITLGKKMSFIGLDALSGLEQLESIYVFSETPPDVSSQSLSNSVYTFADLYVPIGTIEEYKTKDFWKDFINIHEFDPTGINNVTRDTETPSIIFDINGRKLSKAKRGINIINGEKVLVK